MLLIRSTPFDSNFHMLVSELDRELWERYPQSQGQYAVHNIIDAHAKVVLAFEEGMAVGCGCWKTVAQSTVEIKRMYVKHAHRNGGIASHVLKELEAWASEENNTIVRLETGINQPEAIRLYEKLDYNRIDNFDPYKGMLESICMEKRLIGKTRNM